MSSNKGFFSTTDYSADSNRFHLLDALRGLAALWVVSVHTAYFLNETHNIGILEYVFAGFRRGYLGVQIFFVISGFTITTTLHNYNRKGIRPSHFLWQRCKRIFPVYWASIGLTLLLGLITMIVFNKSFASIFPLNGFQWVMNVILMQGPLKADVGLGYWFLSVLLQCYMVMAFGLFFSRHIGWYLLFVTVICSLMLLYPPFNIDGSILKYWNQFAVGIGVFYIIHRTDNMIKKSLFILTLLIGFVGLVFLMSSGPIKDLVFSPTRGDSSGELLFCLWVGTLVLFAQPYDQKISQWRITKLFGFIGLFSYSLYLTHAPIITRVFNLGTRTIGYNGLKFVLFFFMGTGISLIFAYYFFKWFEEPFIKSRQARTFISSLQDLRNGQAAPIPTDRENASNRHTP